MAPHTTSTLHSHLKDQPHIPAFLIVLRTTQKQNTDVAMWPTYTTLNSLPGLPQQIWQRLHIFPTVSTAWQVIAALSQLRNHWENWAMEKYILLSIRVISLTHWFLQSPDLSCLKSCSRSAQRHHAASADGPAFICRNAENGFKCIYPWA